MGDKWVKRSMDCDSLASRQKIGSMEYRFNRLCVTLLCAAPLAVSAIYWNPLRNAYGTRACSAPRSMRAFFCRSGDQPDIRSAPQPRRRPPSLHSIYCRGIGRRHQPHRPLVPDDAMYTTGYGSRHDARQPPQCRDPTLSHHVQISSSLQIGVTLAGVPGPRGRKGRTRDRARP